MSRAEGSRGRGSPGGGARSVSEAGGVRAGRRAPFARLPDSVCVEQARASPRPSPAAAGSPGRGAHPCPWGLRPLLKVLTTSGLARRRSLAKVPGEFSGTDPWG